MKLSKYILVSLVLSLILHIFILLTLSEIHITPPLMPVAAGIHEPVSIYLHPMPQQPKPKPAVRGTGRKGQGSLQEAEKARQLGDAAIRSLFQKEHLTPQPPVPTIRFAGLDKARLTPKLPAAPAERKATAPRPKIVEIDVAKLPPERVGTRRLTPKLERHDVPELKLPSLLPPGPILSGIAPTYDVGIKFTPPKFGAPGVIPDDPPEAVKPGGDEIKAEHTAPGVKVREVPLRPRGKGNDTPVPFDEFVDISVVVRDDPLTGGGYFMATIKANEKSDSIREIPKDVLIIIDRSSSISPKKFTAFKKASANALEYLNPTDRFNIVTFTSRPYPFSQGYVSATDANRKKARNFLDGLSKGGTTSLFDALCPFVRATHSDNGRPLNIFLLTDGISTVNIYSDDDFLRQINGINPGHVSIFPFCAGDEANRELLDFLGLLNRGYSFHAAKLDDVNNSLIGFISNHSSLLIRDIEYITDSRLARNIFPRKLQHLYRGSDVQIYGRYGASDKEMLLTVVGTDADGVKRDVIFRCVFAQCQQTSAPIDKGWAAQKIIHLLVDRTLTIALDVKQRQNTEIKKLASQFDIAVPY